jgi:hypothetical protein
MIDWSNPVETTEDPPRPVRVLATDRPGGFTTVCMFDDGEVFLATPGGETDREAFPDSDANPGTPCGVHLTLRNVAPPKPEPVLRERWFTLNEDGTFGGWVSEHEANLYASRDCVSRLHHRWMSDGSPVPGEAPQWFNNAVDKTILDQLRAERDALRLDLESRILESNETRKVIAALTAERDDLKAEVERLRTRVDGVEENIDGMGPNGPVLQDCVAGEPVTPCVTCKHYHGGTLAYCSSCSGSNDHTREEMRWTSLI